MQSELRKEMLRLLEELANGKADRITPAFKKMPMLTLEAVRLLRGIGALSGCGHDPAMITIQGYDYYEKLKAPRAYWLKNNWFPVAVLSVSSLVTVVASLIVTLLS